jgi:hypothetical protein
MKYFRSTRLRNTYSIQTTFVNNHTTAIAMTQTSTFCIDDRVIKKIYESGSFGVILEGDTQVPMRRFSIVGIRKYYCYDVEHLPVANDIIHERIHVLEIKVTQLQRQLRRVINRMNTTSTATTSMRATIPNVIVDDCSVH